MAVLDLVLEIPQAVPVAPRFGLVLMVEWFFQPVPVMAAVVGPLGMVGHDDVRVTVRLVPAVRVLDNLHQPVDMRVLAELVAVDVCVIVAVCHRAMLPGDARSGQTPAGQ